MSHIINIIETPMKKTKHDAFAMLSENFSSMTEIATSKAMSTTAGIAHEIFLR